MMEQIKCQLNRGRVLLYSHARKNISQVPPIHKKQIFHSDPQNICAQAHQNRRQFPQYGQFLKKKVKKNEIKLRINLTFLPKIGIITL